MCLDKCHLTTKKINFAKQTIHPIGTQREALSIATCDSDSNSKPLDDTVRSQSRFPQTQSHFYAT